MQNDFILGLKILSFIILCGVVFYSCTVGIDRAVAVDTYCTPDLPGYYKPWIDAGLTPCDWAGYECTTFENCMECNNLVATCQI